MSFALEEARFKSHVERTVVTSPSIKAKKYNNEDWMRNIYAHEMKICEFQDNVCKVIAKIEKIYTEITQGEFSSV